MAAGNTSSTLQAQSSVSDLAHQYVNYQQDAQVDAVGSKRILDQICIHHDVCIQMQ